MAERQQEPEETTRRSPAAPEPTGTPEATGGLPDRSPETPDQPSKAPGWARGSGTQPTGAPGRPADASARPQAATGQPVEAPRPTVETPRQPAEVPAQPQADTPALRSETPKQRAEAPERPADGSAQPLTAPGLPAHVAAQPHAAPKRPEGAPEPSAAAPRQPAQAPAQPKPQPDAPSTPQPEATPPLALLAQLTNRPAPPATAARTVARRLKIWSPLVLLLAVLLGVVQLLRPLPDPEFVVAGSPYAFTGDAFVMPWPGEGQAAAEVVGVGSLGTYGERKPVPTASVAKVMTAYVILKDHPLKAGEEGDRITIDATAAKEAGAEEESRVDVSEGQSYTLFQMLQMLLIPSGNNIARQLARWDAGSEDAFAKKMEEAAKDLGMDDTTYTDPSGLDASTVSTAVDQVKLAREVMKNDVLRQIVKMPNADVPGLPGRIYNNNDDLLVSNPGGLGIKTGSSGPAGGALMWAAKRTIDGKEHLIVGATMAQRQAGSNDANAHLKVVKERSYKMIKAVQDALVPATVVRKGEVVGYVDDGLGGRTPVVATKDLRAVGWGGLKAGLELTAGGKGVPHEAKAGTEIGALAVGTGPGRAQVPVALQRDLAAPGAGAKLTRLG
ncbi:D-alanyl-D-alanine carboxypeptidase [Streptosporangium nondiastaticum]|uniref:D-alanyl-D-alanine carboxypeptidase n=1 Tax=Streptosporangium nondiastaticum TaxID=35764 RepID=A0A9X7JL49_9ACTN|nr:D-alanyl-D-alanine carboxypeptidase [Streptosporangium nondiastaticum]